MNLHVTSDRELWTARLMREALVDAILVLRALPGGRSAQITMGWELNDAWRYADDEAPQQSRRRPSAEEISRMERMLIGAGKERAWINGPVMVFVEERRALLRWAMWIAHGTKDPDGAVETEADFCQRIGRSLTSFQRDRDYAAATMARKANEDEFPVFYVSMPRRRRRKDANYHAAGS